MASRRRCIHEGYLKVTRGDYPGRADGALVDDAAGAYFGDRFGSSGDGAGTAIALALVGAKAVASTGPPTGWLASTLLTGEGSDERNTTKATTAMTPAKASNTHSECLSAELVGAGCALALLLRFMCTSTRAPRARWMSKPQCYWSNSWCTTVKADSAGTS